MSKFADLHIHTHFSDSTSSPQEVIEHAVAKNLSCISITDHDTIDGIEPTMECAKRHDIEVIPGIELSSEINGRDVHVLGYLFDYKNERLLKKLKVMQNSRIERMKMILEKLDELGVKGITLEEVCSRAESDAVGRPHLAQILIERKIVSNNKQAFDKYLADWAPAYVPKFQQSPIEAIQLISELGGVAVLAHPMVTRVDELIPQFVKAGMQGIEVYYPNNTDNITSFYNGIAKKHNIVATGGSDAHGDVKKHTYVGRIQVPYSVVEELKSRV